MFSLLTKFYSIISSKLSKEARELTNKMTEKIIILLKELEKDDYSDCQNVQRLLRRFEVKNIIFKDELGNSYVENKQKLIICLRDDKKELFDINKLMFKILHLLTFLMSESDGHTEEWYNNFEFLLNIYEKVYKFKYPNGTYFHT